VGRRRDMKAKTILSLSSMMLIFGLLSLHAPFLGPSALAGEAGRSKFRPPSVKKEISCEPVISQEALLELVEPYLGTPYRWGGASRKGMDCSGFVKHIYSTTFSLDLPHSSYQQHAHPIMKKVSKDQLQTGDLVFFSQKNRRIAHVGIYLADGNFIHAGRRTGVTISSLDSSYWKIRMVSAKRPAGLWRSEDADPARSFSQIEIALNGSGGALNGPASHTRGFSSPGEGLRSSSWQDIFSAGRRAEGLTHTFELQLNHSFGEASWSMSLLQESFCRYSSAEGDHLSPSRPASPHADRQYTLDGYRQGVRMAGDIRPFDWLRITPSFSYVGVEHDRQGSPCWGPGLGLAVQIRPLPGRWSLSADFQYWDEGDQLGGGFNDIDSWKSKNLSLMLGYDLSSDLKLKLVGQHGMGNPFRTKDSASEDERKHNGLFFSLDWAF
jgi:hypothetical protein